MPRYQVNDAGVSQARALIEAGTVDAETAWSDAAPSTDEENRLIEEHGHEAYGTWHLAVDVDASEETKGRYRFPYGDFTKVSRAALVHAKQRASQNDHGEIERAADDLLQRIGDGDG